MTFIAIILALIAERGLSQLRKWREHRWYGQYIDWLGSALRANWLFGSPAGLILFVGLPALVVLIIQAVLYVNILPLFIVYGALVLVFTLGPRDLGEAVHSLLEARAEGDKQAVAEAQDNLAQLPQGASAGSGEQAIVTGVLLGGHERLLAVLMWFFVLGPVGAVLYRLSAALPTLLAERDASDSLQDAAMRLHGIMAWVPLRLTALLYTLGGSTDDALSQWRHGDAEGGAGETNWVVRGWQLLARVGCAAMEVEEGKDGHAVKLDYEESLHEALGLVRRGLIITLAVLAIFTIGGWLT